MKRVYPHLAQTVYAVYLGISSCEFERTRATLVGLQRHQVDQEGRCHRGPGQRPAGAEGHPTPGCAVKRDPGYCWYHGPAAWYVDHHEAIMDVGWSIAALIVLFYLVQGMFTQ